MAGVWPFGAVLLWRWDGNIGGFDVYYVETRPERNPNGTPCSNIKLYRAIASK
jgi:hypothetical protein